ncbi:MAG: DUF642 domain-containing protein [Phycisphaerae bacterium]
MFSKSHFNFLVAGAALAGLSLFSAGNTQANMIQNGDFSANAASYTTSPGYSTAGYQTSPNGPTGWTISDVHVGVNGPGTGFSAEPFAPTSTSGVNDFVFIQNQNVNLYQTVATTAGQAYTLTYDAAARSGETADVLNVILTDATNSNQITIQTPAISDASFTPFTLDFVAPSLSTTVEFLNQTANSPITGGFTVDVSNISLAAVPEPATLGVFAIGGLGLLLLKRRKAV